MNNDHNVISRQSYTFCAIMEQLVKIAQGELLHSNVVSGYTSEKMHAELDYKILHIYSTMQLQVL